MMSSLLIVDDDVRVAAALARGLASEHLAVRTVASAEAAISAIEKEPADAILTDVRMPGMDGLELLKLLRERAPSIDVILMTAHDDLPLVATAMREGARDFLVKPLDLHHLRRLVDRVLEDRTARERMRASRRVDPMVPRRLVGRDAQMVQLFKVIGQVAASRTSVIIRGESGTGKELIARSIHEHSPFAKEPFIAVNCTALPANLLESELFGHVRGSFTGATADRRGRFAAAGRGTIFLDEIGDTTAEFQSKLLRVLQEREYYPVGADRPERTDARVVAATHRDLEQLVGAGQFREDLYYRLRVVEIVVPPLRARMVDVPVLAPFLLEQAARDNGRRTPALSEDALAALMEHDWPGNVREMENTLARAIMFASGDVIRREHLGLNAVPGQRRAVPLLVPLDQVERAHVLSVLRATHGHKSHAARILGVSRPRLDRLIRKYELERDAIAE